MEPSQADKIIDPWEALQVADGELAKALGSFLIIPLRRAQLYSDLSQKWWIPGWLAHRLSAWCPERWLPELRFSEPEVMKGAR